MKTVLSKSVGRALVAFSIVTIGVVGSSVAALAQSAPSATPPIWTVPEIGALPNNDLGRLIRQGRDMITATYAHVGPEVADPAKRYAGNNLACTNCHLLAGTKKFGLALYGIYGDFPAYSNRSGGEISLEDRLNNCMTRSMNGRPLPNDAPEMKALVAYIKFLSTGVPAGEKLPGLGAGTMPELTRAADPVRGQDVFNNNCAVCHGLDGPGHPPQPPDHRPRLHDSATVGAGQFQRWRRHDTSYQRGKLHSLQHAARHRLPQSRSSLRSSPGTWRPTWCRSRVRRRPASTRIFPICSISRSMCRTALTRMASTSGSTSMDRSHRSARRLRA